MCGDRLCDARGNVQTSRAGRAGIELELVVNYRMRRNWEIYFLVKRRRRKKNGIFLLLFFIFLLSFFSTLGVFIGKPGCFFTLPLISQKERKKVVKSISDGGREDAPLYHGGTNSPASSIDFKDAHLQPASYCRIGNGNCTSQRVHLCI